MSGRLQLPGDRAERGAKVSADQGERRNRCDRDQRGNQRVLDRRDARLIVDELENDARNVSDPSAFQEYTRKLQAKVLRNRKEPAATAHAWRRTDAGTDERCFSREQLCVECEVAHTPLPI